MTKPTGKLAFAYRTIANLEAERDHLAQQLQNLIDQTTPIEPVPGNPKWSRRIQLDEIIATLPGVTYMDPPDGGDVPVVEQFRRMSADAERYRKLREMSWYDGPLCVVRNPKGNVKPGTDCPSHDRLDEALDSL